MLKNQKGFSLTEILVASGMLGIVTIVGVQLTKDIKINSIKSETDQDTALFRQTVSSFLSSPSHCNTNMKGRSSGNITYTASTTVPGTDGIWKCDTNCPNSITPRTLMYPVRPETNATWTQTFNGLSSRARLYEVRVHIPTTTVNPGLASITMNTKLIVRNSISPTVHKTINNIGINFTAPVVVSGGVVSGCPKAWNSTVVY